MSAGAPDVRSQGRESARALRRWGPWAVVAAALVIVLFFVPGLPGLVRLAIKAALVLGMPCWAVLIVLSGRMKPRRFRTLLFALIALGGVSTLALLAGELTARIALGGLTTTSDNASYFARRWRRDVRENDHGFREREFSASPGPGVYRIAVVGDSLTWGQGIAEPDRFSNRIESLLGDAHPHVEWEVLNFGTPGHESEQHVRTVSLVADAFDPDFILVQWYPNDMEGADKSGRPVSSPLVPSVWLHRHSALVFLLDVQWSRLRGAFRPPVDYVDYLVERFEDPSSAESLRAEAVLREVLEAGSSRGVPTGFVAFPLMNDRRDLDFLAARVGSVCDRLGATCMDLTPSYVSRKDWRELRVNRFDSHPSAEANRVAARAIVEHFGPIWVAKTQPGTRPTQLPPEG